MIARIWRGWAKGDNAARYHRHFRDTVQPHLAALPGFCGCLLLEDESAGETAFTAITQWRSRDDIRAFAGSDIAIARIAPAAAAILCRYDETARHSEVTAASWLSQAVQ